MSSGQYFTFVSRDLLLHVFRLVFNFCLVGWGLSIHFFRPLYNFCIASRSSVLRTSRPISNFYCAGRVFDSPTSRLISSFCLVSRVTRLQLPRLICCLHLKGRYLAYCKHLLGSIFFVSVGIAHLSSQVTLSTKKAPLSDVIISHTVAPGAYFLYFSTNYFNLL